MSDFIDFQVSSVPEYLKTSVFYQTLNESDDGDISLPAGRFKLDTSVSTDEELVHLLSTLQFWGSDEIPDELLDYFLKNDLYENVKILDYLEAGFLTATTLRELNSHNPEVHMNVALQTGSIKLLNYLLSRGYKLDIRKACVKAVKSRKVDFLQHVHQLGGLINIETASSAVQSNNLECFKYCMENGVPMNHFYYIAAAGLPEPTILNYLHSTCPENPVFKSCRLCLQAIDNGRLECVKYLLSIGGILHQSLLVHAARVGRLDIFVYLDKLRCPRSQGICVLLAQKGHLECLKYAHKQGFFWDETLPIFTSEEGHLSTLQYAHENGFPLTINVCNTAARGSHAPILRYISKHHGPWDTHAPSLTCLYGSLECLKILHEGGCPWNETSTRNAALKGHMEILVYLHTHGCPWNAVACEDAAMHDKFEVLVYLHENGCPWDVQTCIGAALQGSMRCLEYAVTNGCECDVRVYAAAKQYNQGACMKYLNLILADK